MHKIPAQDLPQEGRACILLLLLLLLLLRHQLGMYVCIMDRELEICWLAYGCCGKYLMTYLFDYSVQGNKGHPNQRALQVCTSTSQAA